MNRGDTMKKQPAAGNAPKHGWVKTPTIYQMEAAECGAACLGMVLAYYGCEVPLEQLRIDAGVSRDGCNAKNVMSAARRYGLQCRGFSCEVSHLLTLQSPCIIHWNFNHFVVYEGVRNGCPYINDPAFGRRKLTMQELDEGFTGIVLVFAPTPALPKNAGRHPAAVRIRQLVEADAPALGALLSISLLLVVSGIVLPTCCRVFIDKVFLSPNAEWLGPLLMLMLFMLAYSMFFNWLRGHLLQKLHAKLSITSTYRALAHLLRLPIQFFEQRYAGDIAARVSSYESISEALTGSITENAFNLLLSVFYLVLMLLYSVPLTMIGVVSAALALGVNFQCARHLASLSTKARQDNGKLVGTLYAGLSLSNTLKASGAENEYISRLMGYYARSNATEQLIGKRSQVLAAIPQAIEQLCSILVLLFGGIYIIRGRISIGMLFAFQLLLTSFLSPVTALLSFFQHIQTLQADVRRVGDLEKYRISGRFDPEREQHPREDKLIGRIELRDVSFGYSTLKPALIQHFSFTLEPGQTVALVGGSGCGKSTISKLISGLYRVWSGDILLDGTPMQDLPQSILNASVAVVNQSITFFSGSIRDNLTLWNDLAMERDILNAAKDACIHDVITALPGAYDYRLAEGGTNLSGGQRQRLEIARALVTNPSILILDEATSALDPLMEKQVLDNIRRRGCTCIMVAHRLSTIRDCDEILVMQSGQIIERGTHETLMDANGTYAALIRNG